MGTPRPRSDFAFAPAIQKAGSGVPQAKLKTKIALRRGPGRSWSKARPLPPDMLSSQPKATVLGNGALLVSAGRPGNDLWASVDGFGRSWQRASLGGKRTFTCSRDRGGGRRADQAVL